MFRSRYQVPTLNRPIPAEEMGMRNNKTPDFTWKHYLRPVTWGWQTDLMSNKEVKAHEGKMAELELEKIDFSGREYSADPIPGAVHLKSSLEFFKHMTPDKTIVQGLNPNHGRLECLVPPTLVASGYFNAFFYTNTQGYLCRRDDVKPRDVMQAFGAGAAPDEVVAVAKTIKGGNRNTTAVVQGMALKHALETSGGPMTSAVQKFIWPAGPTASVVRVVWKPDRRDAAVYVLSNRHPMLSPGDLKDLDPAEKTSVTSALRVVVTSDAEGSFVVVRGSLRAYAEPVTIAERVAVYVGRHRKLGVTFAELVVDFVRGCDDRWWLLNVKAFRVVYRESIPPKMTLSHLLETQRGRSTPAAELKGLKRRCRGDYCKGSMMTEAQYQLMMDAMPRDGTAGGDGGVTAAAGGGGPGRGGSAAPSPAGDHRTSLFGASSGRGRSASAAFSRQSSSVAGRSPSTPGAADRVSPGGGGKAALGDAGDEDSAEADAVKGAAEVLYAMPFKSIVLERSERATHRPEVTWLFQAPDRRWAPYGPNEMRSIEAAMLAGDRSVQLNDRFVISVDRMVQYHVHEPLKTIAVRRDPPVGSYRIPPPYRAVPVVVHNRFPTNYYELVPVCANCFKVYQARDQRRLLDQRLASDVSPFAQGTHGPAGAAAAVIAEEDGESESDAAEGTGGALRMPIVPLLDTKKLLERQGAAWRARKLAGDKAGSGKLSGPNSTRSGGSGSARSGSAAGSPPSRPPPRPKTVPAVA